MIEESAPQPNTPEARTPDGTLKDQSPPIQATPENTGTPTNDTPPTTTNTNGAPEAYADFAPPEGAPEGFKYDPKALADATAAFKELGLTQEQAQKLIAMQGARDLAAANASIQAVEAMRQEWRNQVQADPEIGGSKLEGVKVEVGRALSLLDPKVAAEFRTAMDTTGVGDNPAFIKAFYQLAKMVNEGKHVSGAGPSPNGAGKPESRPTIARAMYPNLSS